MTEPLRIAILGAESTGKTSLALALREELKATTGRRIATVAEVLREWCDAQGRTPAAREQRGIAEMQHRRIEDAAALHDVVVSDTTALMTAVYSRYCFGDRSLDAFAVGVHRSMAVTLLMAVDLPWHADGFQRDGEHVREPVDAMLRELLIGHGLPFCVITGRGERRVENALLALRPWLKGLTADSAPSGALFGRLLQSPPPSGAGALAGGWLCECCVPDAERASLRPPSSDSADRSA